MYPSEPDRTVVELVRCRIRTHRLHAARIVTCEHLVAASVFRCRALHRCISDPSEREHYSCIGSKV